MRERKLTFWSFLAGVIRLVLMMIGAVGLTLVFFLVLPLMQKIGAPEKNDLVLQTVDTGNVPPPPPPPPEEQEPEEQEPDEQPPELSEEAPPLDLSQLELALNVGTGEGWATGDFAVKLNTVTAQSKDVEALFQMADLDQKPRPIYQPPPNITSAIRRAGGGTVYIIFIVNKLGRVEQPKVQQTDNPALVQPALSAVKKWKFEPGKRNGQPVRFRMRVPITFPKGR